MKSPPNLASRHVTSRPADEVLDPETVEMLGTNEYLVRRYRDQTLSADAPGTLVNLNVNYDASGSSTPHVPEICWAGSGREESPDSCILFWWSRASGGGTAASSTSP